ncbi:hypothetical protein BC355_09085 [Vibrio cholerae]|uniref:Uncharacterized protein n=1 Tax=Vibrio cholerae TaxID=666 RepID=A0A395TYJ8_VIBCL|nr:hypothetical protein [Vibrio cholerae]EGR0263952.1 hypothetical protein [Vibrio cholerae]EGR0524926.1 hypothetical protein [Vibrio cholerae]EGR0592885.1 hypothetical protein [Vibrio cholerae]EGR0600794.1 hypothetical protein [Vibrio cholerae]EGZ6889800.1 hypothetical protein [Vibrio cholerae]
MNPQRQLRQVRLETNIANEFKLNADAFVVDISELFDEVVTQFLTEHKHKKITYLSQPKEIPVTNVRLLPSVLEKAEERANQDKHSVPNLLYTAFMWYAKKNQFTI